MGYYILTRYRPTKDCVCSHVYSIVMVGVFRIARQRARPTLPAVPKQQNHIAMAQVLLTVLCLVLAAYSCQAQSGSGSGQGGRKCCYSSAWRARGTGHCNTVSHTESCAALNCTYMCNEDNPSNPYCVCKMDQMLLTDGRSCAGMYMLYCSHHGASPS